MERLRRVAILLPATLLAAGVQALAQRAKPLAPLKQLIGMAQDYPVFKDAIVTQVTILPTLSPAWSLSPSALSASLPAGADAEPWQKSIQEEAGRVVAGLVAQPEILDSQRAEFERILGPDNIEAIKFAARSASEQAKASPGSPIAKLLEEAHRDADLTDARHVEELAGRLNRIFDQAAERGAKLPTPENALGTPQSVLPLSREAEANEKYGKLYVALKDYLYRKGYHTALKALAFAKLHHNGKRKDGFTPEFQHQIEIALFIKTLKNVQDEETAIAAAMLHDLMEDYGVSRREIARRFGKRIADIVWLLTKKYKGKVKDPAVYFDAIAGDPDASLVKGADRVHNVQSMPGVFTPEKQRAYLAEVEREILPMLKRARQLFPEQQEAYYNITHMLRSQIFLLRIGLDGVPKPFPPIH